MKFKPVIFAQLLFLLIPIIIVLTSIPKNDDDYISIENEIIEISYEDNRAIIQLLGDETLYTFYEKENVSFEILKEIGILDYIKITVDKDYKNFEYPVIYKLECNNSVLFDYIDYYYNQNIYNLSIFLPTSIITFLGIIILFFMPTKERTNNSKNFIITSPSWIFDISITIIILSLVPVLIFSYLYIFKYIDTDYFLYSIIFMVFLLIAILLLYCYLTEKFIFTNNEYTYSKPFLGKKSIKISDLLNIEIHINNLTRIKFINKNGKTIISFLDDGTSFKDGLFLKSLKNNDIPCKFYINKKEIKNEN